jgi:hypothetical protein
MCKEIRQVMNASLINIVCGGCILLGGLRGIIFGTATPAIDAWLIAVGVFVVLKGAYDFFK